MTDTQTRRPRSRLIHLVLGGALALLLAAPVGTAHAADSPAKKLVDNAARKLREQDLSGAIALLEEALDTDPRNPDAHLLYQDVASDVLGVADLRTAYAEKAAAAPEDALFQYLSTRLLEPEDAANAFDRLIAKFRKSPWPLVGKARVLEEEGQIDAALKLHDEAIARATGETRFRAYQAFALERSGRWNAAVEAWTRVSTEWPKDLAAQIGLGEALRGAGRPDEAISAFSAAQKLSPVDPDPYYRMGLAHLDAERWDESLASLKRALAMDETMVPALCASSESLLKKAIAKSKETGALIDEGVLKEASTWAIKAVASNPDSAAAHFSLGAVYEALGEVDPDELETSLTEYDDALDLLPFPGPEKVRLLNARAYVLLRLARYDEALATVSKALDIEPDNVTAMVHGSHALNSQDKFKEAISQYLDPGLKIAKDEPRLVFGKGMTLWNMEAHSKALKFLEKAVELDPENGIYRLALGEIYYELKKNKQAGVELTKAIELRPMDSIAWTAYGRVCTSLKDWEYAVEAFEKVIELDEESVDEYLYLGMIYYDYLKDVGKAQEYIEQFLERGGDDPNMESWFERVLGEDPN